MDKSELAATRARIEKLRALGKIKEAGALLDQIKVDDMLTEGKRDEALLLAVRFGHEPHDKALQEKNMRRLRRENSNTLAAKREVQEDKEHALDAAVFDAAKAANTTVAISKEFAGRIWSHLPEQFKSEGVDAIKASARRIRGKPRRIRKKVVS